MAKKINFTTTNPSTLATLTIIETLKKRISNEKGIATRDCREILASVSDIVGLADDSITNADIIECLEHNVDGDRKPLTEKDRTALLSALTAYNLRQDTLKHTLEPLTNKFNASIKAFVPNYLYDCYTGAVGLRNTSLVSHELFYPRLTQWLKKLGYDVPDVMSEHAVAKNLDVFMARVLGGKKSELTFKKQVYANFMSTLTVEKGVLTVADDGEVTNTYAVA